MKKIFCFCSLAMVLAFSTASYGFSGCEEDCLKCHTLTTKEAQQILTAVNAPDAKPVEIRISPIKGLWEVTVDNKGARSVLYVGFSKTHIIRGPIFEIGANFDETLRPKDQSPSKAPRYVDYSSIPVNKTLLMGNPAAKYKAFVFTDPDCPYCSKLHDELKKVIAQRKDIAFSIKLLPLSFHKDAYWKSQTVLCTGSLKILEDNFAKKPVPKPECMTKEVDENIALGRQLGITGTPTLIMPDGLVVTGAKDAETIIHLIVNPTPWKAE